jgi:CubicO group peptidase (beta-lactamase class C family)
VTSLAEDLDGLAAETSFSGVVRVDRAGEVEVRAAYGLADRAAGVAMDVSTQLGIASGGKGLTALAVMSLIEERVLELSTPARVFLGDDLPLVGDVTIEQLLGHTSGIGDYLDEDLHPDIDEYLMTVPLQELATTEGFLPMLEGHPPKHPPGERFSYCNGGYVVLALVAERASGVPYHHLVVERVCRPAGMERTAFLRSDELPPGAAVGYLARDGLRTNLLHLPVRGTGDGGVFSTGDDVHAFWAALFGDRIVGPHWVEEMVRPRSDAPEDARRYGLGFWVHPTRDVAMLDGYDAGASFRTAHDPSTRTTYTVISNTSEGAWPLARHLGAALFP